jgi:putative ABC transport system permease protein
MNEIKLILLYSTRIVIRQWRRFVLPFLSLGITAIVLTLILLVTQASSMFLQQQSRSLLGGDIVIESSNPINAVEFWERAGVVPEKQSNQIVFSATLQGDSVSAPFSVKVVDDFFPLYGDIELEQGTFIGVQDNEIYLDSAGAKKLGVTVGNTVTFGQQSFVVGGIISADPTSLFAGFRFFPQAIISQIGFTNTNIDPQLLRAEYLYAGAFAELSKDIINQVTQAKDSFPVPIDIDIAGQNQGGLQFGLEAVSNFLILAVLITAILSAVNVYASTLYFVGAERRNLAVFLALGLRKKSLAKILGSALGYIVVLACIFGIFLGNVLFVTLSSYIATTYAILLPIPNLALYSLISLVLIAVITIASFVPAIAKTLSLNPKQILIGGEEVQDGKSKFYSGAWISLFTFIPLMIFASFLLNNIFQGIISILAIGVLYIIVAGLFSFILFLLYKNRSKFSFFVRSIISQKKADGFFGIISFSSLFIALVSIGSLALIQLSLEKFLTNDIAQSVPSTYVLDIQPSQKDILAEKFPDLTLFENIRARIISIDELQIQDELAKTDSTISRELGREYNLTSRDTLLANEVVTKGVWSEGRSGEISVDENFADQANINLGSTVVFSIQGFEIEGVVTSFRQTDSRSGLPFFYFILSPQDVAAFPAVYFGYSFADIESQNNLSQFVATQMPNISVLDTQSIGLQILNIVRTLLVIILIITLPPLLIATLLVVTLVVSSYESRRREGARMRALGATRVYVLRHYLVETISLTLVSALISYILSVCISFLVNKFFLKFDSNVFFDGELVVGLGLIVLCIGLVGFYLFKRDTAPLRELISYETNL